MPTLHAQNLTTVAASLEQRPAFGVTTITSAQSLVGGAPVFSSAQISLGVHLLARSITVGRPVVGYAPIAVNLVATPLVVSAPVIEAVAPPPPIDLFPMSFQVWNVEIGESHFALLYSRHFPTPPRLTIGS